MNESPFVRSWFFDEYLVARFKEILWSQPDSIPEREAEWVLKHVQSDPRLDRIRLRETDDVEVLVHVVDQNIASSHLSEFTDRTEAIRREFCRAVAQRHLERIGRSDVPVAALDLPFEIEIDSTLLDSGEGGTKAQTEASQSHSPQSAPETDASDSGSDSQGTSTAPTTQPGEDTEIETPSDDLMDDDADVVSEGDGEGRLASLIESKLEQIDPPSDVRDFSQKAYDAITDAEPSDLEWLLEHREALAELIRDESAIETVIGILGFLRVAQKDPSAVAPYLDLVEDLVSDSSTVVKKFGLVLMSEVSNEDPLALLGFLDPVCDALTHEDDEVAALSRLTIRAVAHERPTQFTDQKDQIAAGLERESRLVRISASKVLVELAREDPTLVKPYIDSLVRLVEEDNQHAASAAVVLEKISADSPKPVQPHLSTLIEHIDLDHEIRQPLLKVITNVSEEHSLDQRDVSQLVALLDEGSLADRKALVNILVGVVNRNPDLLEPHVDDIAEHVYDPEEAGIGVALIMTELADLHPDSVVEYAPTAVSLLETVDSKKRIVILRYLRSLALERPDAVLPHKEVFVEGLGSDNDAMRVTAAMGLGYLSQSEPAEVAGHVCRVVGEIDPVQDTEILIPLTDVVRYVAEVEPEVVIPHLDTIEALVESESDEVLGRALSAVLNCIRGDPSIADDHFGYAIEFLNQTPTDEAIEAMALVVRELSSEHSDVLVDYIGDLLDGIHKTTTEAQVVMLLSLYRIAKEDPEPLRDYRSKIEQFEGAEDELVEVSSSILLDELSESEGPEETLQTRLEEITQTSTRNRREGIVFLVREMVMVEADLITPLIPWLFDILDTVESDDTRQAVMNTLRLYSRTRPENLVEHVDEIAAFLSSPIDGVQRDAAMILYRVEDTEPGTIGTHLDAIGLLLSKEDAPLVQKAGLWALGIASDNYPDEIAPFNEFVVDILLDTDPGSQHREPALDALISITQSNPSSLESSTRDLLEFYLETSFEDRFVRLLLLAILAHLASQETEPFESELDALVEDSETHDIDTPVANILSEVAADSPEKVAQYTDHLLDLVDTTDTKTALFCGKSLYYVVDETGAEISTELEPHAARLQEDPDEYESIAMAFGLISKADPDQIAPYADELVETADACLPDSGFAALDALRNIAKEDPELVEPYEAFFEDLQPIDGEQSEQAVEEILQLISGEDITTSEGGDYDDDEKSFIETVYEQSNSDDWGPDGGSSIEEEPAVDG